MVHGNLLVPVIFKSIVHVYSNEPSMKKFAQDKKVLKYTQKYKKTSDNDIST